MGNNAKATVGGWVVGVGLFMGTMVYHAAFPNYAAGASGGTVTVWPIRKDDGVLHMVYAIGLGIGGFWATRRGIASKLDKNGKA